MDWILRVGLGLIVVGGLTARAQSVQPVITEYKGKADGKFAVTNNTTEPLVVVLEPKSFDITPEGKGMYRALDAETHVELSSMSVRLQPKQTYYVFYKAWAERLPAWFTVYATFSSPRHSDGLDVRLMLPHTVYLYQKQPLLETDLRMSGLHYDAATRQVLGTLENAGGGLARVQMVRATGEHGAGEAAGFPLVPGGTRRFAVDWTEKTPPNLLEMRFKDFTYRQPVTTGTD